MLVNKTLNKNDINSKKRVYLSVKNTFDLSPLTFVFPPMLEQVEDNDRPSFTRLERGDVTRGITTPISGSNSGQLIFLSHAGVLFFLVILFSNKSHLSLQK